MHPQSGSDNRQLNTIVLEITPQDEQDADPAAVGEVGRNAVDMLHNDGYMVKPISTGRRGGIELLFEVITFLETISGDIWAHRDIPDLSALCTIFGTIRPILMRLLKSHGKQDVRDHTQDHPIKVTVKIESVEISVGTSDLKTMERVVMLAERFICQLLSTRLKDNPEVRSRSSAVFPNAKLIGDGRELS